MKVGLGWLERRRPLWIKSTFSIVALVLLVVTLHLILGSIPSLKIFHPGFWVLLILVFVWFYLFVVDGLLCLYGLLRFDFASRLRRNCNDCLNDLKNILDRIGINYKVRRLIKEFLIKTNLEDILLVSLSYRAGPNVWLEFTAIFCSSTLLSYDDLTEYIIYYHH